MKERFKIIELENNITVFSAGLLTDVVEFLLPLWTGGEEYDFAVQDEIDGSTVNWAEIMNLKTL